MLAATAAFAADDPWAKVQALKSGTEIRVMKKGATQPLVGKIDEADAQRLILVVKTEQLAIAKDQIDRVDYRPAAKRVTVNGTTTQNDPAAAKEPRAGMNHEPEGGGTTSSAGINVGSKPDFETIYRRPIGAPKK
jgi:hypothetical protein